jgi:putative endonuclease
VQKTYYVYILASQRRVLYLGMTSNIEQRIFQHKTHAFGGFTAQFNVTSLVHFERYGDALKAIRREKEIKGWRREKKLALIESENPTWRDLSYGWYQKHQFQPDRRVS